jgi:two-component system response regulator YesN
MDTPPAIPAAEKRILVVDDSREFGTFVRRVAEMAGFVVEVVETAERFRAAFPRFQPAIICLDIVMPMEDGIELISWLIEQQSKAAIYIVTGHNPSYARAALEIGRSRGLNIAGILQKPVSLATLRDILTADDSAPAAVAAD